MAGHQLIDAYLDQLTAHVRWRSDSEDVVAEVRDHLHTAVERRHADGADLIAAQQETLERFGQPDLVATALATTNRGGVAVPTHFTRQAGTIAMVAAGLWIFVVASWWVLAGWIEDRSGDWGGGSQMLFSIGTVALITAVVLTGVTMLALRERNGGLGALGSTGLVCIGLGALLSPMSWLYIGWGAPLAIGTLLFSAAMRRVDVAPRASTVAFGLAWTLALLTWTALRAAEVGGADRWGDYWVANWAFLTIGSTTFAVGLVGLGRWLRSEDPADLGPIETLATA